MTSPAAANDASLTAAGGGSDLIGRKPEAFAVWAFELMGLLPGDEFVDLYPGSGIMSRAWEAVVRSSGRRVV